ncbi:MAG TPA: GDSL-type esterase/lipase family protein, partial [Opitutus sp.]|nr:GDSL-type esterase/lipase family protein [Opitutus sp.]
YPERIRDLNVRIRQLAATDAGITVVDTFTPLAQPDGSSKPDDFVADRLHLNAAGYVVWHDVLDPVLESWQLAAK